MKIALIRHFQTEGNQFGRYIGITDEDLLPVTKEIEREQYLAVDRIYVSPLKRCIQTANILYPERELQMVEELKECDFGRFENKNYQELGQDKDYQEWINSGGTLAFPEGEEPEAFKQRSRKAFLKCIEECLADGIETVAFVVHGGTIMSIMSAYDSESKEFYDYHVKNGKGYLVELREEEWKRELHILTKLRNIE